MFDLIQAVLSGAAFDRVLSFFRRVAARLAGRLRKAGITVAQIQSEAELLSNQPTSCPTGYQYPWEPLSRPSHQRADRAHA